MVALLATVMLPGTLPAATGKNAASSVADWPGARISPAETPLSEYPAPETLTFEIVIFELPAFVRVTLRVLLFPRATVPKFKPGALEVSSAVAAVAVPLRETVFGVPEALLKTEISPDRAPAVFGENTTSKVDCFPAARVRGSEIPEMVMPAAVVLAWVMVMFDSLSLDTVTDCEAFDPRLTKPNLIDDGSTEMAPDPDVFPLPEPGLDALVSPMQP